MLKVVFQQMRASPFSAMKLNPPKRSYRTSVRRKSREKERLRCKLRISIIPSISASSMMASRLDITFDKVISLRDGFATQ